MGSALWNFLGAVSCHSNEGSCNLGKNTWIKWLCFWCVLGTWQVVGKSVMTVDIPVPLGRISAVCHVLCPTAFEQDVWGKRSLVPGGQKISSEYLDQTGLSQTGTRCTGRDFRLGGRTPLAGRGAVPILSHPRNASLVSQTKASRHISKCKKS